MQEEFERSSIRLGIRVAGLSAKAICAGLMLLIKKLRDYEPTGLRSIKQMMKNGDQLIGTDQKNVDLERLIKVCKRYNVGFAAVQHEGTENYTLFFKAENREQMKAAIDEYINKTISRETPEAEKVAHDEPSPEKEREPPEQEEPEKPVAQPLTPEEERDAFSRPQSFDETHESFRPPAPPENKENDSFGPPPPGDADAPPPPGDADAPPEVDEPYRVYDEAPALETQPVLPQDVSLSMAQEKKQPPRTPPKRSIPKELEQAKIDSRAMDQARQLEKQKERAPRQKQKELSR